MRRLRFSIRAKYSATLTELLAFGATRFQSALHLSMQNHFVILRLN
jgi:hypothetical protein